MNKPIARPHQFLDEHLNSVSRLTSIFTGKIGLAKCGLLIGWLHDIGKFSDLFQKYIRSIADLIDTDDIEYFDAKGMKGKIDHSTAGAQWVWRVKGDNPEDIFWAQILALCIASHHSGLIDCLSPDGKAKFINRIEKDDSKSFFHVVEKKLNNKEKNTLNQLVNDSRKELLAIGSEIAQAANGKNITNTFHQGLLSRYLLSCLIDADRLDSANGSVLPQIDWRPLLKTLEDHIEKFESKDGINRIRRQISNDCKEAAQKEKSSFFLTVPTGSGKTLASLRFALHHAVKHGIDRIFYIIPYTSIIEQNAQAVRDIFEDIGDDIVLEHHSNLTPERDTERNRLLAENWDSPIVFTTAVQFLETIFSSGTRGVRRMHRLANSIIIFDEPQSIPLKITHLFNQALNFLQEQCASTIVLCTATQPILDKVCEDKGAIKPCKSDPEIVPDGQYYFASLKRVIVKDNRKDTGYTTGELATLITSLMSETKKSVLFIANTKAVAKKTFNHLKNHFKGNSIHLYHLSTNMCAAHRREVLDRITTHLKSNEKVICVSTQLIEAGVNISFQSVVRSLAGLDSIAQAAGRCNRHGEEQNLGEVLIVNCNEEVLSSLHEIRIAQEKTERMLGEFSQCPDDFDNDILGLKAIRRYYELYFFERKEEMVYQLEGGDNLLNQLSLNSSACQEYARLNNNTLPPMFLRQSFASAGRAFQVIDAPTEGVVVPYNAEARVIIGDLCGQQWDQSKHTTLIKKAQCFSINIFPNDRTKLLEMNALYETQSDSGIFFLDERFYDQTYGLSLEGEGRLSCLMN